MHPRDQTLPRHRRATRLRGRALLAGAACGAALAGAIVVSADPRVGPGAADQRAHRALAASPLRPLAERRTAAAGERPLGPASRPTRPVLGETAPGRGAVVQAAAVLRAWDERRAEAWAGGDVAALRDLYVDGAGAADVRLLRRYADRGYRVDWLTTQLLAVEVLERGPDWWRLRVTDRLAGAVAVRGEERIPLPHDRANTHVVVLTRADGGRWRVAVVRAP